jgi:cell division protein FtsI/penicillin-binding protein 2
MPGRDLKLTVDIELEQSIERAMRGQLAGAVVVVDVRTGRLLALYSKPDFDLNDVSGGRRHGSACDRRSTRSTTKTPAPHRSTRR